jgi:hypothetical protein
MTIVQNIKISQNFASLVWFVEGIGEGSNKKCWIVFKKYLLCIYCLVEYDK